MTKRIFDAIVAVLGLMLLAPVMLVIAVAIRMDSRGPALFRQVRVGMHGRTFEILKFRTMTEEQARDAPQVTAATDSRITRCGRYLRRTKLDELPQLINVARGDMSLVGPRPEVPKYIALYTAAERQKVLSVRPGITDNAAILFSNESELLARSADPEQMYVREILPRKLELYMSYVDRRSFFGDLSILLQTVRKLFFPQVAR